MSQPPAGNQGLMPSVLDRLIDPDADGKAWLRGYGPHQMLESVRRDLEELFNTHCPPSVAGGRFPQVERSIAGYGMPDFHSLYAVMRDPRQEIPELVAAIVARFEPRLRDVKVRMVGAPAETDRNVRLQIEGRLNVDPSPEVAFETVVELTTGRASIRSGES